MDSAKHFLCGTEPQMPGIIRQFFDHGPDPNVTDETRGTRLHCAINFGLTDIIQLLLDAGADPMAQPSGTRNHDDSPVQMAQRSYHPNKQVMLDLLRSG
ncbi:hypothetical protein N7447_003586 [Penicillium robsamsonii]|uniref:uncharacterized protein n=1 Tax=Penicillium robsamsonii TaxID=1792511 RepID=UPI002548A6DF|nr:uncharacterized protein N7447_003586 [Penicillium robsamsonii]KAJ5826823.1 hypothetical protein N7447_003586 [Penicillium robsamsonii]